jgi:aryl-alcohol dehydrogenase-like predicted oxidoreductase
LSVSPIGYGAFKIGRNVGVKYAASYALPDDVEAERLLNGVLDLGVTYIDTAPAYGLSEERIGRFLSHRRREFVLSTKVGERFESGQSSYDFSANAVRSSVQSSLRRLRTDAVDVVFIHAHARDEAILSGTDAVPALLELRQLGWTRAVGLSAKTLAAARMALEWADVLMVEYHAADRSFEPLLEEARQSDVGIVVKKPLASGLLPAESALRFVLATPAVSSALVSSLSLEHLRENVRAAG